MYTTLTHIIPGCFIGNTLYNVTTWWRHQMETFSALLALCVGNSPVTGEFPSQRPVTRSFDVFFDLCLNKRLSKQSRRWWSETPLHPLLRHCNEPHGCPLSSGAIGVTRRKWEKNKKQNKTKQNSMKISTKRKIWWTFELLSRIIYSFRPNIPAMLPADILICNKF